MCFSAEASFIASAVLSIIGVATLRKVRSFPQFFLAAIPSLFALQQSAEGFIWLYLKGQIDSNSVFLVGKYTFLFFAFLVWPIWIPHAILQLETVQWRRFLLAITLLAGITLSISNFLYALTTFPHVEIVKNSLHYIGRASDQTYLYPMIVLLPCFISSLKKAWLFGILTLIAYLLADYFYTQAFISVWCFFAAVISLLIYIITPFPPRRA